MAGKDIPFNFERRLQQFFYHVAVLPSMECGLIPQEHLTVSGDGTAVHTHACPYGHHRDGSPDSLRHFSVSFLVSFHELEKHMPAVSIENMCLDSAMDNYPTYRILQKKEVRAFIDLNDKCGRPKTIPDTITNGYLMWRCPYGKEHCSRCKNSCTDSKYGRVVKTRPDWDIRLYTDVPRGTDAYKKIYKQRTATERITKRILQDISSR